MKKILFALAAFISGVCQAQNLPPYGSYIMQADPTGVFFYGRYFTPTVITDSYFLVYDGNISQPKIGSMGSSFTWNGTTLDVGSISQSQVSGLTSALSGKFNTPTGTTSQYVRGDGSLGTTPTPVSRSFSYTTRALNTCFQISSSRDAQVSYAVDVSTSLSLTTGQQGTVYLRTYTNSGCSTGTQELVRFQNGQTGTLTIGLALTQNVTGNLSGIVPAGAWVQLVTENNVGTPTFTARPGQEVQL
jgi:hypothetical protein